MLTVEQYETREQQAVSGLPNRVVEMVSPITFASEGYPARVRSDSELWKYVDVMHETRFERDLTTLFGGRLTEEEFTLLRQVAEVAGRLSKEVFGHNLTTRGSLLPAINIYRHIASIVGSQPARVFEIGPGSGGLGCLFVLNGWSYAATDIAQAFYLIQNRLWSHASGGRVKDLANDPEWNGTLEPGRPVHVPWWEFFKLLEQEPPAVDVVTCNHALAEMHPNSLAFSLRVARRMLRGGGIKAFAFEGWGFEKFTPRSAITKQFYQAGFNLVHNDDLITIFAPQDADCASPSAKLPRFALPGGSLPAPAGAPISQPVHRRPSASTLSAFKSILGSLDFLSGTRQLVRSLAFLPPPFSSPSNVLSKRILERRQRRGEKGSIGIEPIRDFYAKLLNSQDLRTPDERFLDSIGRTY